MSIIDLKNIVLPPAVPAENRLNTHNGKYQITYPPDYIEYCHAYGTGTICGTFIEIFNFLSNSYISDIDLMLDRVSRRVESGELDYKVYPEESGLFPFGCDENSNVLCWNMIGPSSSWSIVILEQDSRAEAHDGPMTSFLTKVFENRIKCKIWHEPFTKEELVFSPRTDKE